MKAKFRLASVPYLVHSLAVDLKENVYHENERDVSYRCLRKQPFIAAKTKCGGIFVWNSLSGFYLTEEEASKMFEVKGKFRKWVELVESFNRMNEDVCEIIF